MSLGLDVDGHRRRTEVDARADMALLYALLVATLKPEGQGRSVAR